VWKLRQKLEADPDRPAHLVTVHGIGYRFVLEQQS
jgi:DNA-binding response OmpR family regulator